MIVRINQIDVHQAETLSGWPEIGLTSGLEGAWPEDTYAFELLILETDESGKTLPGEFRCRQLRTLLPDVLEALRQDDELLVIRLDGALREGEMLDMLAHVRRLLPTSAVAVSPIHKLAPDLPPPQVSVRMSVEPSEIAALCEDEKLGLDRGVRLRAMLVPETLVPDVLEIDSPGDPRWAHALPLLGAVVSTTQPLRAVQIITPRFDPAQTRVLLTRHLVRGNPGPEPANRAV
jgi:hypothetical protein